MPDDALPIYQTTLSFRRSLRPRKRVFRGVLSVAPVVDVGMLIAIFFMTHASFVLQPGIIVELPEAEFAAGTAYGDMIVTVSQQGFVFFNDEKTTLQGLASAINHTISKGRDRTLVIQADRGVSHDTIVKIYDMAQQAGVRRVALGAQNRFAPAASMAE